MTKLNNHEPPDSYMIGRPTKDNFVFYYHFIGWSFIRFGVHICFNLPNIEIHLPFGFIRIGWAYYKESKPEPRSFYLIKAKSDSYRIRKPQKDNFQCYFHFVSLYNLSLGVTFDFNEPCFEIHIPFGFFRIGWNYYRKLKPKTFTLIGQGFY